MDWAPKKYDPSSWGKGVTGVAGGKGFGANFMRIAEESEVSWLLFTGADLLEGDELDLNKLRKNNDDDMIEEDIIKARKRSKEVWSCIKIRLPIFFVLSYLFMLFFWYFISCFCSVYKNTQKILIYDMSNGELWKNINTLIALNNSVKMVKQFLYIFIFILIQYSF